MATIRLNCAGCGSEFEKHAAEVKRQRQRNPEREFYCSLACFAKTAGKSNLGRELGKGDASHLDAGNRKDEFSPFRYFMNKARNRKKLGPTNLDLPYLKALWEQQNGRCALSGLQMTLPATTAERDRQKGNPWKASLDRVDNDLGYVRGNVRFVTNIAMLAMNGWSDDTVVAFCRAVAEY